MAGFFLRRATGAVVSLLFVALAVWLLFARLPAPPGGNAWTAGAAPGFAGYLAAVARLDFGRDAREGRPVLAVVAGRLGVTVSLALPALILAFAAALPLGTLCATRRGGRLDRVLSALAFLLYALPAFFAATILLLLFSRGSDLFPLFPTGGLGGGAGPADRVSFADHLHHLALPIVCLAAPLFGALFRYVRAALLETLPEDFITAARGRGLSEARISLYALAAGAAPVLSLLGTLLPAALSSAAIVETVFAIPGIGLLVVDAVAARDLAIVSGSTLATAAVVIAGLLASDLVAAACDPRVARR